MSTLWRKFYHPSYRNMPLTTIDNLWCSEWRKYRQNDNSSIWMPSCPTWYMAHWTNRTSFHRHFQSNEFLKNENVCILIQISLKFLRNDPTCSNSVLVQVRTLQWFDIGSGNGLALNRLQAIDWTTRSFIHISIIGLQCVNELNSAFKLYWISLDSDVLSDISQDLVCQLEQCYLKSMPEFINNQIQIYTIRNWLPSQRVCKYSCIK